MSEEKLLMDANPAEYPLYTLKGLRTIGKFVTNYDGDTCHILMYVHGALQRHNVRMMGYDSPEMKPALSDPKRDEKKKAALHAKERLAALCGNGSVLLYVECHGPDKYGRQLMTIYTDTTYTGKSVNQCMIDECCGYTYDGGTKIVD